MNGSITLTIPEDVSERARAIATATAQPVERVLLNHLQTLAPLPTLPPDEQAELDALRLLSDDALRTIAAEQMTPTLQARMQILMDRNTLGQITSLEYTELERLVERGNRLMVRKAEAAGILMERGNRFQQQDFLTRDE
jgi:hypothetical protein